MVSACLKTYKYISRWLKSNDYILSYLKPFGENKMATILEKVAVILDFQMFTYLDLKITSKSYLDK